MPPLPLSIRAPAKVNLFLNVTGRRADGYHEIDSLFAFCGLHDRLTLRGHHTLRLETPEGPFAGAVEHDGGNLVLRSAELLQREAGVREGALMSLRKDIPVAAGLGGGSADAAATLTALNGFWGLNWPRERLERLAEALGADVPACVRNMPVYARGIGERLEDAPGLPDCGVLLVNPRVATHTPAVFRAFRELHPVIVPRGVPPMPKRFADLATLAAAIAQRGNDLMMAAVRVTPVIADVVAAIRALPGVAHAGLSGSGATCFALCDDRMIAARAMRALEKAHPEWWAWSGGWAS